MLTGGNRKMSEAKRGDTVGNGKMLVAEKGNTGGNREMFVAGLQDMMLAGGEREMLLAT